MPLDVGLRLVEEHPAKHLWFEGGSDVGCMVEPTVPVRLRAIEMLGSMDCGAGNI